MQINECNNDLSHPLKIARGQDQSAKYFNLFCVKGSRQCTDQAVQYSSLTFVITNRHPDENIFQNFLFANQYVVCT